MFTSYFCKFRKVFTRTKNVEISSYHDGEFPVTIRNEEVRVIGQVTRHPSSLPQDDWMVLVISSRSTSVAQYMLAQCSAKQPDLGILCMCPQRGVA